MKLGSIVYSNNSGLGTLARSFYDNGILHKVLTTSNGRYKDFPERFPNSKPYVKENLEWLLEDIDGLLFFETPFDDEIINIARKRGIKTVIMPMYECTNFEIHRPDLWIAVSSLNEDYLKERNLPYVRLNVPVDTSKIKWREREYANTFLHNGGHGGIGGRNGTYELIKAMDYVKSDIKLIINSQADNYETNDPRITFNRVNYLNYWDLWQQEADVFIFPERFCGLSLPIQEAYASGMMIMCTDRRPFNEWLPKNPLIPHAGEVNFTITNAVKSAVISPEEIAKKIDEWAGKKISTYSRMGKQWAEENSFEALKQQYFDLFI